MSAKRREKRYRVEMFKRNEMIVGPNTNWLWIDPTTAEALICLNGAYADGFKAGRRATRRPRRIAR